MPKGRHRKPQQNRTQLPAGARVLTGKARTSAKQAAYAQPLPVSFAESSSVQQQQQPVAAKPRRSSAQPQSWTQFLAALVGWGQDADQQWRRHQQSGVKRRPDSVIGQWDPLTRSVHLQVTRPVGEGDDTGNDDDDGNGSSRQTDAVRLLWECGFFGKGTLSRSEPTWRARQISTLRIRRQQARGQKIFTPEELTALRRKERKAAKIERARLAVRAGQQLADGIVALGGELTEEDEQAIAREVQRDLEDQGSAPASLQDREGGDESQADQESAYGKHIPGLIYLRPKAAEEKQGSGKSTMESGAADASLADVSADNDNHSEEDDDFIDVEDMESLQLTGHEVLFLAGMLGVLDVIDEKGEHLEIEHLYALLLSSSLPPAALAVSPLHSPSSDMLVGCSGKWARPDNPFLLTYVAYHHFRSLGWVVRTGIKFCVDLLLYKKGPAFSHAEFAIVVLPVYEDPADAQTSPFGPHPMGEARDWVWFSSVNRVNTQVLKTLILCYVTIPPLSRISSESLRTPQGFVQGLQSGSSFRVREYAIRRFTPQRMRA